MTIRTTKELRLRRGTTSEHSNFIGAPGEITVDTDLNTIRVHDGVTPAGHLVRGTGVGTVSWTDVINKPTIPAAQIQSDWTQANNTLKDFIKNKPDLSQLVSTTQLNTAQAGTLQTITTGLALKANIADLATVATSGSYADLIGKPSIPVVPTTVSSFANDAGYLTSIGAISYNDLSNKPSLFSGSYDDLIDQPIIPSIIGLATENYVSVAVANLVNSSPATLDTLNELATALGNDVNFSTTVATALGNRLRVDTDTQNLDATQQSNAITNLGLATVATSAMTGDLTWSVYSTEEDLPNATSVHGMFAHVHSTGHGYMAHAGNWIKLANYSDILTAPTFTTVTTTQLNVQNVAFTGTGAVTITSGNDLNFVAAGVITFNSSISLGADGKLTLLVEPTNDNHAATKGYVDNQITDVVAGQGFATLDYVEDAITSTMAAARTEISTEIDTAIDSAITTARTAISTEISTAIDTAELDGGTF